MNPEIDYRVNPSGDSRQDLSISLNKHAKEGKTALFDAVSSGDSRQEVYKGNYVFQSDIVFDSCFAYVNVLSSGDSRQDFNIFTDLSPKAGKTALFNAVSSGDSRQDCFTKTVLNGKIN
ncbi:MAG: hypothetical protein JXR61_01085 [Prolixibacteraceae bacterium]|nr:hypothetical protein [Prolixibacteraceae bacterium]